MAEHGTNNENGASVDAGGWDLLIKDGLVVTDRGVFPADVAVRDERIVRVETGLSVAQAAEVVDAGGMHVFPGVIDPHVHLGIPMGWTESTDDFYSGTTAAVCGGVTTVIDFTIQAPGQDLLDSIRQRMTKARSEGVNCDFSLHANITSPSADTLSQIPDAVGMGVTGFKTFLAYPDSMVSLNTLAEIAALTKEAGGLVMVHAEMQEYIDTATQALESQGRLDSRYFFDSRPEAAEAEAIHALGRISRSLDVPFYIVHLSSASGLDAALQENRQGARLYVETCPHYLFLNVRPAMPPEPYLLVASPPLRSNRDSMYLTQALGRGAITTLGTDHCPFTRAQKMQFAHDFRKIPGGLPGVETLLPLAYHLTLNRQVELPELARMLAANAAALFGLRNKGRVQEGYDADIVLLNPAGASTILSRYMHSRTDYSPFEGFRLNGAVEKVFLRGRLVAQRHGAGMEMTAANLGRFVPGQAPIARMEVPT